MDLFELDAAGDALLCCAKRVVITMLRFNAKRNIIMASAALSLHYAAVARVGRNNGCVQREHNDGCREQNEDGVVLDQ